MEALFHRLILLGTVTAATLQFPELIAWHRLLSKGEDPDIDRLQRIHRLLRTILRTVFSFYIILLAYALYHPTPSKILVYPLMLFHLAALIVANRDLVMELPNTRWLDRFVHLLIVTGVLEIVLLSLIALQLHGVIAWVKS